MSERVEQAVAAFEAGYNCAEAIVGTYGPALGLGGAVSVRAASGLGAGLGRRGEVCGAVSGATVVLGLRHGREQAEDKTGKDRVYGLVREFLKRFEARMGAIRCRELLGMEIETAEGLRAARESGRVEEVCPQCVRAAAGLLEEML